MESSAGSYVTSYDTGSKPFNHDTTRGRWASNRDFYIACVSHAFGIANFSLLPVFIIMHGGVFVIIPYLISMCLFTLPIFFIQSFLGQFSSTGFISVFRISPLFKGIGYVILLLNIVSACINSITASYTLAYFFASFSIELPWMSCNHTWNDPNCTEVFVNGSDPYGWYDISWSTVEYFQYEILNFQGDEIDELRMSWPIFGANIVVWIVVGCVLHKGMDSLTKFMRYSLVFIFGTMFIVFLRFSCFPDAMAGLLNFITPTKRTVSDPESWIAAPFLSVLCFGTGWGTVLTMASFNKFNVNITRSSVLVNLTTLCGSMLAALIVLLADDYLQEHLHFNSMYFKSSNSFNFLFIGFPYLFGNLEASQMWSMLFFLMLTVCELNAVILIIFTTLTAAFDEYEFLRTYKKYAYLGTPAVLFLFSIAFATNHGFEIFSLLIRFSGVTQMGLCFIEIIMLVWIYGRLRFQRDVQFMLGTTIRTWMIYLVRFITPLYILFVMMGNLIFSGMESYFIDFDTFIIIASLKFLPWIIIPLYMLYKLYLTTGSFKERFRRNTRPNDWYPAIANDRQRYEEALGTADISHQLMYIAVEEDE